MLVILVAVTEWSARREEMVWANWQWNKKNLHTRLFHYFYDCSSKKSNAMISRQSWYTKLGLVYNAVLKSLQQKCRMHYVYFRKQNKFSGQIKKVMIRLDTSVERKKKVPLKGIEPKTSDFAVMRYSSIELHKSPMVS